MFSRVIHVCVADRRRFYNLSGSSKKKVMRFADDVCRSLLVALEGDNCEVVERVAEKMVQRAAARRKIKFEKLTEQEAKRLIDQKRYCTTYTLQ